MKSQITDTPAKDAGMYISSKLEKHKNENILFLISGGSAFAILPFIETQDLGAHITISLVDERFTRDEKGNNFLQLQQTDFYKEALGNGVQFIESVPRTDESYEDFTKRIKESLETYIYTNPNSYSLGIFGIGEDGHTAGIFKAAEKEFTAVYKTSELYMSTQQAQLTYPMRTTITPVLIEEVIDDVVLYAIGTNKCENILDYMYNRTFAQHEIPALIPASHPQSILFTDCPTLTP